MFDNFDIYTIKARLAPALIVLLPIGMAIGAWFPLNEDTVGLLSTSISSLALLTLFSQLARGPGKRIQSKLFAKWGGMPSALMLSYSNTSLPIESRARSSPD